MSRLHGATMPPVRRHRIGDQMPTVTHAGPDPNAIGLCRDWLTRHVHILEMNDESYRLKRSLENAEAQAPEKPKDA